MVSPYLERPLRSLDEVMSRVRPDLQAQVEDPQAGSRRGAPNAARGQVWRKADKAIRPRLVWSNEAARGALARRRGGPESTD